MPARLSLALAVLLVVLAPSMAPAQSPVEAARALVARYHEDPTVIDRARDLLEAALARDRQVDTLVIPNSLADWTAKDLPRARELLGSLKGK